MEEGEIPATTEAVVVVLDPEEETPVAADLAEAGQVAVVGGPLAPTEPEVEKAPSSAGEGEAAGRGPNAGARRAGKHRAALGRPPFSWRELGPHGSMRRWDNSPTLGSSTWSWCRCFSLPTGPSPFVPQCPIRGSCSHTARGRVDKYKKQCQALSERLTRQEEEAKAREEDLGDRIREAESRAETEGGQASAAETKLVLVSARLEAAGIRMEELGRQLQHMGGRANAVADEARAAMERVAAAEMTAVEAIYERARVVAHADEARARTEEAEGQSWEVEMQVREAEARANNAITDYKASPEFEQEVIEASLDAYAKGFDLCKVKVSAAFNINSSDLEKIQPGDLSGEESGEEEAGEEPGPSGP